MGKRKRMRANRVVHHAHSLPFTDRRLSLPKHIHVSFAPSIPGKLHLPYTQHVLTQFADQPLGTPSHHTQHIQSFALLPNTRPSCLASILPSLTRDFVCVSYIFDPDLPLSHPELTTQRWPLLSDRLSDSHRVTWVSKGLGSFGGWINNCQFHRPFPPLAEQVHSRSPFNLHPSLYIFWNLSLSLFCFHFAPRFTLATYFIHICPRSP